MDSLVNSVSQVTWRGYVSAWFKWCTFCDMFQCGRFSGDPAISIAFICHLVEEGLAISSSRKVLSGYLLFASGQCVAV